MKCKFISSTNTYAQELIGKEVNLSYGMQCYFTFDTSDVSFDFRHGEFSTSLIRNINIEEISLACYKITIDTRNSQYVFQKGELSDKKPLTKDEIFALSQIMMF